MLFGRLEFLRVGPALIADRSLVPRLGLSSGPSRLTTHAEAKSNGWTSQVSGAQSPAIDSHKTLTSYNNTASGPTEFATKTYAGGFASSALAIVVGPSSGYYAWVIRQRVDASQNALGARHQEDYEGCLDWTSPREGNVSFWFLRKAASETNSLSWPRP